MRSLNEVNMVWLSQKAHDMVIEETKMVTGTNSKSKGSSEITCELNSMFESSLN